MNLLVFPNRGYVHPQGSVYQRLNYWSIWTFEDMMELRAIAPLSLFPSVLKACQMFSILDPVMVATKLRLGGMYSPLLFGPMPTGLIPPNVPFAPMAVAPNPLPVNVRNTPAAHIGHNWAL
jgi:hypothetical protein